MAKDGFILLVEDNPGEVLLVKEALRAAHVDCDVKVLRNGREVLDFIIEMDNGQSPVPSLVILNVNLPRVNGYVVLERLRASARLASVKVLVMTTDGTTQDRRRAQQIGANGYFRKSPHLEESMELGPRVRELLG